MDIERKNLEILFKEIPFDQIQLTGHLERGKSHTYSCVNKKIYLEFARRVFPHSSEDEIRNNYFLLDEEMKNSSKEDPNLFAMIYKTASKMLTSQFGAIQCRLDEMLRWREISFLLGQDFFTCVCLAGEDLKKGINTRFFAWEPIICSDDFRLNNILERGVAENHFHLNGSTKIFELNWICLMNSIENRGKEFQKFEKILQHDYVNQEEKKTVYQKCLIAALYRLYLFFVLHENQPEIERLRELILEVDQNAVSMWIHVSELQDMINLAQVLYGVANEREFILDYALERDTYDDNNNACRLLSGERRFLYSCYKKAFGNGSYSFSEFDKNVFYRYLVLRTFFRSEMIQVNRRVGFSNFAEYQDRKEYFIDGRKEYEYELVQLAVNASFQKQNIVSLEARICPDDKSDKLARKIRNKVNCIQEEDFLERLFFVLHFPKNMGDKNGVEIPRNAEVRRKTEKYANAIVAMLERNGKESQYIRGIDACAGEIGCRPEVFAQYYRYLLDYSVPIKREGINSLMATYHVGEDFLDIVDGLRAIDEVLLFCGMRNGDRLGHALALGIDPDNYYRFKNRVLVLPAQDLLDNLAWLLVKQEQCKGATDKKLESELEQKFYELFYDIYGEVWRYDSISYSDYYNSWQLRGDWPGNYLLDPMEFEHRLNIVPLRRLERYEFNNVKVSDTMRKNKKYRELYRLYHYDKTVREKGKKEVVFKVPCGYAELVRMIQDKMIEELVCKGIGIETNPSSNYLIGTIQKYSEHPVIRFNGRKLKSTEVNRSLQVSINTDDQGVFDTSLENEYALMAIALKKEKTEDNQSRYDMEDIYAWIDYVRRMGITQAFKKSNRKY